MTIELITSQSYIDDEIVSAKIEAEDFEVQVSPIFEIDERQFRVILDGHHSFAAAIKAGVEPILVEQSATDDDRVSLLNDGHTDRFLEAAYMDGDFRNAETGAYVW